MVRKPKASLAFAKLSVANKIAFGNAVINAITANAATFPNLPVPLETLSDNNSDLAAALLAASSGDHVAEENLQLAEETWINNFRLTAIYIDLIADGNGATIKLAGFETTKTETTSPQTPGTPGNLQATVNGNKGNLQVSCNVVPTAKAFVFTGLPDGASLSFNGDVMQITINGVTAYVQVTTKRKATFTGVPSGAAVGLSVYAVNSAGSGPLANGQHVIAQ